MVRQHHNFLIDGLRQFLVRETLCDVTLCQDQNQLHAHKVVLAASSPIFYTLLATMCKWQGEKSHIVTSDVETETIRLVLAYAYPGILEAEGGDLKLESACKSLEFLNMVDMLHHRCEISMMDMDFNSVIRRWRVAATHRLEGAAKQIIHYLLSNFESFLKSPYFAQIPFELLAAVVSCEDEHLVNEHLLLCALHKWVLHCPLMRISYTESLLTCMRAAMYLRGNFLTDVSELLVTSRCQHSESSPLPGRHSSPKLRSPKASCPMISDDSVGVVNTSDDKRERTSTVSPELKTKSKKESVKFITTMPHLPQQQQQRKFPMCERLHEVVEKLWEDSQKVRVTAPLQTSTSDPTTNKQNPGIEIISGVSYFENIPAVQKKSMTPDLCKTTDTNFMKGVRSSPEQKQHGICVCTRSEVIDHYDPATEMPNSNKDNIAEAVGVFINSKKKSVVRNKQEKKPSSDNYSSKQKLDDLIQTIRAKLDMGTTPPQNISRKNTSVMSGPTLYRHDNLTQSDASLSLTKIPNRYTPSDQPSSFQAFKLERYRISKTESERFSEFYDKQETSSRFTHSSGSKIMYGAELTGKLTSMTNAELVCSLATASSSSASSQRFLDKRSSQLSMWATNETDANVTKRMRFVSKLPEDVPLSPRNEIKSQNAYKSYGATGSADLQPHRFPRSPTKQITSTPTTDAYTTAFGLCLPTASPSHITPDEIEKRLEKFKQVMNVHDVDLKGINLKGSQSFVIPCIGDSDEALIPEWEMEGYLSPSSSDDELCFSAARMDWANFDNGYYRVLSTIPEECQEDMASSSSVHTDTSSCQQTSPSSVDINYPRRKPWGLPSELPAVQNSEAQQSPLNSSRINSPVSPVNEISQSSSDAYPSWVTKMCEANKSANQSPVPSWSSDNNPSIELFTVNHAEEVTTDNECANEANTAVCTMPAKSPLQVQHTDLDECHLMLLGSRTGSNTTLNVNKKSPGIRLNLHDARRTGSPMSTHSVPASGSSVSCDDILSSPRSIHNQGKIASPGKYLTPLPQWLEKLHGGHDPTESVAYSGQSPRSSFSSYSPRATKSQQSPRCLMTPESVRVLMLPETPSSSVFSVTSEQVVVYEAGTYSAVKTEVAYKTDSEGYLIKPSKSDETGEFDGPESYFQKYQPLYRKEGPVMKYDTSSKLDFNHESSSTTDFTLSYFSKNKRMKTADSSQESKDSSRKEIQSINRMSPIRMSKKPIPHYKKVKSCNRTSKSGEMNAASDGADGQAQLEETATRKKSDTSVFVSLKELENVHENSGKTALQNDNIEAVKKPHKKSSETSDSTFVKNSSELARPGVGATKQCKISAISKINMLTRAPWDFPKYGAPTSIHSDCICNHRNNMEFGPYSPRTLSYYSDQREYTKNSKKKSGVSHPVMGKHIKLTGPQDTAHQAACDVAIDWKGHEVPEVSVRRVEAVFLPISMVSPSNKSESTCVPKAKQINSRFTDMLMESETSTIGGKTADPFINSCRELNFLPSDIGPLLVFLSENDQGVAHRYCYSLRQKAWLPPLTLMVPEGANNCSIAYYDNKIYFIGGDADSVYRRHNSMRAYNCLKNCLETLADMGLARVDTGVTVFDEHIYVIGGLGKYHKPLAQVERYNIAADSWKLIAAMRHARSSLSIATVAGLIYAIGGIVTSGKSLSMVTRACERYDPTIDQWSEIDNLPSHFDSVIPLVVAIGERLYAVRIKGPEKVYTFNMNRDRWMAVKDSRLAACSISVLLPGKWRMYAVSASTKIIFVFDFHAYQWQIENHFPEEVKWMQLAYSMNLFD